MRVERGGDEHSREMMCDGLTSTEGPSQRRATHIVGLPSIRGPHSETGNIGNIGSFKYFGCTRQLRLQGRPILPLIEMLRGGAITSVRAATIGALLSTDLTSPTALRT